MGPQMLNCLGIMLQGKSFLLIKVICFPSAIAGLVNVSSVDRAQREDSVPYSRFSQADGVEQQIP